MLIVKEYRTCDTAVTTVTSKMTLDDNCVTNSYTDN